MYLQHFSVLVFCEAQIIVNISNINRNIINYIHESKTTTKMLPWTNLSVAYVKVFREK